MSIGKQGMHMGNNNPNYKNISLNEIYDLYYIQHKSMRVIAEIFGCERHTISRKLKELKEKKKGLDQYF